MSSDRRRNPSANRAVHLVGAGLLGLLALAIATRRSPGGWRAGPQGAATADAGEAGDTVRVFGPKVLDVGKGRPSIHVERFARPDYFAPRFTLVVENGDTRASHIALRLNGVDLLASRDFNPQTDRIERTVALEAENILEATVGGPPGASVTLQVIAVPEPTFAVYGPRRVERVPGTPAVMTDRFGISATAAPPYTLIAENGSADGSSRSASARSLLNGIEVLGPADLNPLVRELRREVRLAPENAVQVEIRSGPGSFLTLRYTATDTTPPVIRFTGPPVLVTNLSELGVTGTVEDETAVRVKVNDLTATVEANGSFGSTVPLPVDGRTEIHVVAIDAPRHRTDSLRQVIRDSEAPVIALSAPGDGSFTNQTSGTVTGTVTDLTAVSVTVNGLPVAVQGPQDFTNQPETRAFAGVVPLAAEGGNLVTIVAIDQAGNSTTLVRQVVRDTRAPVIAIGEPADGATTTDEATPVRGTVEDLTPVTATLNGAPLALSGPPDFTGQVESRIFDTHLALVSGPNSIVVEAEDGAGNVATITRSVTRLGAPPPPPVVPGEGEQLPIDSGIGASALDLSGVTRLGDASRFLYEGDNPLQTGVAPGVIAEELVAVVRGRVLQRDSTPLAGVVVSVRGRPEFGSTETRETGVYDVAVNGSRSLVLEFTRPGFLPVQRHVDPAWRDYEIVDNVVMIGLDANVTAVDFSAPVQVARGSVVTDEDGTRRATALFKQGTIATAVLPDGSEHVLPVLHVRATEYTVGPFGPEAMPGELPPTSNYTYAVELSADEALAAGATTVRFSKPVSVYLENFLNLAVGSIVPVGSYDREGSEWVPSQDGVVVKVLGITNGLADLDTDGSGTAADAIDLAVLGIDDAERETLAGLYQAGQSLWRARVQHVTPIDLNLLWDCLAGTACTQPGTVELDNAESINGGMCPAGGSIIECQNQILGERIPIVGAAVTLNYRSDRAPGRLAARHLRLRLVGPTVPAGLQRVDLQVDVAGRRFKRSFAPAPDLLFTYAWDGRDTYGRLVQGTQPAAVRIGYTYQSQPITRRRDRAGAAIESFAARPCLSGYAPFAQLGPCEQTGAGVSRSRSEITLWRSYAIALGSWDARAMGLGGWTPDPVHFYDNVSRTVYLGGGSRQRAETVNEIVRGVAGSGVTPAWSGGGVGPSGEGGDAEAAAVVPVSVAIATNGSVVFADGCWIREVDSASRIATVLGNVPGRCFIFPGGQEGVGDVRTINFGPIADLLIAPDNSIYFTQPCAVWRLVRDTTPQRRDTLQILAGYLGSQPGGDVVCGLGAEGSVARGAKIGNPREIALAPDGSLYIGDGEFGAIRRVGRDGRIFREVTNIVGVGTLPAYGPDGSLYFVRRSSQGVYTVRRLLGDGSEQIYAGSGTCVQTGQDGIPARQAGLCPIEALALDAVGNLYVGTGRRLRVVGTDGIITTLVGTGTGGFNGNGRVGLQTQIFQARGIAVAPDGAVYFADQRRLRRVGPSMPGFALGEIAVPSEDGSELYRFTSRGRHLETINTLTGARLWQFAYDTAGRIESLTDGDGNVTRVLRNASGEPTEIVAPFGQRTALTVAPSGYLTSITNPADEKTAFAYTTGGLLTRMTNPLEHEWRFDYDATGRLVKDSDPAGGSVTLGRTDSTRAFTVAKTTAIGRTTRYGVQRDRAGAVNMGNTFPSGAAASLGFAPDATRATRLPDGTVVSQTLGPDPRWGMQAPVSTKDSVRTPAARALKVESVRTVQLAAAGNPLSLLKQTDTIRINGRAFVRSFDAASRQITTSTPLGRSTTDRVDSLGRLVETAIPGVTPVQYTRDANGRLVAITQGDRTWGYVYDASGRLSQVTDPLDRRTRYSYDASDRLTQQVMPDGSAVGYGHDAAGNVTAVTPPGRPAHRFRFTPTNLLAAYDPPALGPGSWSTTYSYDADRNLTQVARPDGQVVGLAYDSAGRPQTVTIPGGALNYSYASTGRLTSVTGPYGGSVGFAYDGSLLTGVTWTGEVSGTVSATYNNDFRVTGLSVNGGSPVSFTYDADGLLTRAGDLTISRSASNGMILGTALGQVSTTQTYTDKGELASFAATHGSTSLFSTSYVRDGLGRIRQIVETVEGVTTTKEYAYDLAGRLIEEKVNGTVTGAYEYDANGNRTRVTTPSGTLVGVYDEQDRLLSLGATTYTYSRNGERTAKIVGKDTTRYEYDPLGNLRRVSMPGGQVIEYVVDALGRRVGKKVNGLLVRAWLYQDQLAPATELDGSGNVVARFVYGTRVNVPDYILRQGVVYRVLTDHLGSARLAVNVQIGDVSQRAQYNAWGVITEAAPSELHPFGFAGGIHDSETRLVRLGARDLDPAVGRWNTKDPIAHSGGQPNLYAYVGSDPVNRIDLNGLFMRRIPPTASPMIPDSPPLFESERPIGVEICRTCLGLFVDYFLPEANPNPIGSPFLDPTALCDWLGGFRPIVGLDPKVGFAGGFLTFPALGGVTVGPLMPPNALTPVGFTPIESPWPLPGGWRR